MVKVNSEVAHIGQVVDPETDHIELLTEEIKKTEKLVYYKFNKPRDIETTCAQK
jgi:16S rRNA U516 pseudouridylate synthase RsuA-like enzyme